jgi:hypothetical protein
MEPDPFREAAQKHLSECGLFVQLLSEIPFKETQDSENDYGQLLVKLAQSMGKPILQWRHPQTKLSRVIDESHRTHLTSETVRAESLEDFKREVCRRAFEKPPAPQEEPMTAFVLVDTIERDKLLADQICDYLISEYGAAVVLLQAPGENDEVAKTDPKSVREGLEENFKKCDALIVVYGQSASSWVVAQYQQWRKCRANIKRPQKAIALFNGPPERKIGEVFLPKEMVKVIDCRKGFDKAKLRQFLEEVRQGTAK